MEEKFIICRHWPSGDGTVGSGYNDTTSRTKKKKLKLLDYILIPQLCGNTQSCDCLRRILSCSTLS